MNRQLQVRPAPGRHRTCALLPADPEAEALRDWPMFREHCCNRPASALPCCAGELEILGDAFIGAGRDKSNARCCRPYRQLHPAVARGGDMFESDPKEIIYSSRSRCVFESK